MKTLSLHRIQDIRSAHFQLERAVFAPIREAIKNMETARDILDAAIKTAKREERE